MAGKRSLRICSVVLVVFGVAGVADAAPGVPETVSPGAEGRVVRVAGPCPSFSWGAVAGALSWELVAYELSGTESGGGQALGVVIPGSALSWTPSLGECLAPGSRYVWFVRAIGAEGPGEWSRGRLFEIVDVPTIAEVEEALRVLERFVGERGGGDARETAGPTDDPDVVPGPEAEHEVSPGDEASALLVTGVEIGESSITIGGDEVVTVATDQDTLGGMSCADGQLAKWNASFALWECGDDLSGTSYAAGNQLELVSSTFNVVEGSGSGLDADLLDGKDSAEFAARTHPHSGADIISGLVAETRIDPLVARDSEIMPRVLLSDGAGTGLDADLLDGLHGSAFVRTIGDTMTGQLTLASDLALSGKVVKGGVGFLSDDGTGGNLALGREALLSNATGDANTAIGYRALRTATEGRGNTAVGSTALEKTYGSWNTALGVNALKSDWDSNGNTAVGAYALENSEGYRYEPDPPDEPFFISQNTAVGYWALRDNVSGHFNTAAGAHALSKNVSGSDNTALGYQALSDVTGGSNTGVGYGALGYSTGYYNTAVGWGAGASIRTGWYNIMIGNRGETGDDDTIRLGTQGTQTRTFIAGISGTTLSGSPVVVTSEGQLGVTSASGIDAETLDGLDSTQFLRRDVPGTVSASVVGDETLAVVKGSGASPSAAAFGVLNTMNYGEGGWFKLSDPTNTLPVVKLVLESGSGSDFVQCDRGGSTKCRIDKNGTFVSQTFRLQPTDAPPSCGSVGKGGLYYDMSLDEICLCNGTSWRQLDGGGSC
jgi:hypothetical protein